MGAWDGGGARGLLAGMNAPDLAHHHPSPAEPALRDALLELVGFGVRIARVVAEVTEAEGQVVAVVRAGLPGSMVDAGSLTEAQLAGLAVDAAEDALSKASPRIAAAAQAFDRVSRAVRRTAALVRRLECGWPRRGGSDDRQAMARRQIARSVGERITGQSDGEAAERLFDDLAERLDALDLAGALDQPVEAVIAEICRELGLEAARMTVRVPLPGVAGLAEQVSGPHPTLSQRERAYSKSATALPGDDGRSISVSPEQRPPDG